MKNYGSVYESDCESNDSEGPSVESKFKSIASQCCGVLASDSLKFTTSTFLGFHILLIAELIKELHENNLEMPVTLNEITWIASLNFLVPIGSIINGFVTQHMGSRIVMLSSSLMFIIIWLLYYFATNIQMILVGRILYSLTSGALKTSTSTYITEISLPNLRGSFLATYHLAATFGMFFSLLMGSFFPWRTITLINIIFPVLSIIIILVIPDSPMWLASKGRYQEAEAALSWLRGWVNPNHVRSEYRSLLDNYCGDDPSHNTNDSKKSYQGFRKKLSYIFEPYMDKSFYRPLATMTVVYFVHFFSGATAVVTYSIIIFNNHMKVPVAPAYMGAMRVAGAFVVLFCIRFTGKRRLIFTGLLVSTSSYFLVSGVNFFGVSVSYTWISPVALILAIFANAFGVDSIVHMLNTEIFPVSIRYIGSSIGSSIGAVMLSGMNKVFLYILDTISLSGLFLYLGLMNVLAIVTYYFIFPETEGRTLREIEDHYKGVKKLDK